MPKGNTAVTEATDTAAAAAKPPRTLLGKLKMGALALLIALGGWIGEDLYGQVRNQLLPSDDPLGALAQQQQAGFDELKAGLASLRGSVDGEGRAALKEVAAASEAVRRLNQDILAKLRFAEEENRSLQRNLQASRGVGGGHDFLLAPQESIKLDGANVFGLDRIGNSTVWVSLTSTSGEDSKPRRPLRAGESIAFRNARGQDCKVSLMSLRDGIEVASFALVCPPVA